MDTTATGRSVKGHADPMGEAENGLGSRGTRLLYIQTCADALKQHRPELLSPPHKSWKGPLINTEVPGVFYRGHSMMVVLSPWDVGHTGDERWLHVSFSRRDQTPGYHDMMRIRGAFFRPTDTVLHVFPPSAEHYSLHPYCLHLWTPLDGSRPIPDPRGTGGGV